MTPPKQNSPPCFYHETPFKNPFPSVTVDLGVAYLENATPSNMKLNISSNRKQFFN